MATQVTVKRPESTRMPFTSLYSPKGTTSLGPCRLVLPILVLHKNEILLYESFCAWLRAHHGFRLIHPCYMLQLLIIFLILYNIPLQNIP